MPKSADILLECRQEGRKTWAIRFYQDGLVKEYSDSTMQFENDKVVTHSQPLAWRKLTQLSPAELEKFIKGIRQADFFSLPQVVGDPHKVLDGTQFTWKVNLDDQQKTVQAYGALASNHPSLKLLNELIQEITADAFDREAEEK
jgi:hypothetical protein